MAKKGGKEPERQTIKLDPAVASIIGDQQEKQAIRQAPKDQAAKLRRQRDRKAAEQERQAARNRITLELDQRVTDLLQQVSGAEQVSPASAANWLLANALVQYARGDLPFEGCKFGTDSPRWPYTVDLGQLAGELEKWAKSGF